MFRSSRGTDLNKPAKDDDCQGLSFLSAPYTLSCCGAFSLGHGLVLANVCIDKRLLRWGICVSTTIMRGISPPLDSKINGPNGVQDVVDEKYVGKIEHVLRILLCGDKM